MATINEGQSSKNKFPFDMNNLFNMQYSFDQLKLAIEYLAKQQSDQQQLLNELLSRDPSKLPFEVLGKDGSAGANGDGQKYQSQKQLGTGDDLGAGNGDSSRNLSDGSNLGGRSNGASYVKS